MMSRGKMALAAMAGLATTAQPVLADDFIYQGNCDRARSVMDERNAYILLPFSRYRGVKIGIWGNESCGRSTVLTFTLTQSARDTRSATYNVVRRQFEIDKATECSEKNAIARDVTGTVTFSLRMEEKRPNLCEVYLWSDWTLRRASEPGWQGDFAYRAQVLDNHSFVVASTPPNVPQYQSPMAFTGVQ